MPCFNPIVYLLVAKQCILFIRAIQVMQMTSALLVLTICGGNCYLLQTDAEFLHPVDTIGQYGWSCCVVAGFFFEKQEQHPSSPVSCVCVLGDTDTVYCARVRCFVLEESRKEVLVLRFVCKHLWNCFYNSSRVGASVHV